jgi:cytidylate kinase
MYRALTWAALRDGIEVRDDSALTQMAEMATVVVEARGDQEEGTKVSVNGADATPHLREPAVEANVSLVSRVPGVRAALVKIQRELAADGGVVMVGRDIGSVVLPDAEVKVYLDASAGVRARRRTEQLRRQGVAADASVLEAEITRRDSIDSSRETSPLTAAREAVIINTDDLSIEEVVRRIAALVPE